MYSLRGFRAVLGLLALSLLPSCAMTSGGINTGGMETPTQDCGQSYKIANNIPELRTFAKDARVEVVNVQRGANLVAVNLVCLTTTQVPQSRSFKVTTTGCWMNPPNGAARVWKSGERSVEVYDVGPAPKDAVKDKESTPAAEPSVTCKPWEAIRRLPALWNN